VGDQIPERTGPKGKARNKVSSRSWKCGGKWERGGGIGLKRKGIEKRNHLLTEFPSQMGASRHLKIEEEGRVTGA